MIALLIAGVLASHCAMDRVAVTIKADGTVVFIEHAPVKWCDHSAKRRGFR